MSYTYQSMPSHDPVNRQQDNIADVEVSVGTPTGGILLLLADGEELFIPNSTILRGGVKILPGGDDDVNVLQIRLIVGEVTMSESSEWTEVVPGKRKVAFDGRALEVAPYVDIDPATGQRRIPSEAVVAGGYVEDDQVLIHDHAPGADA